MICSIIIMIHYVFYLSKLSFKREAEVKIGHATAQTLSPHEPHFDGSSNHDLF